MLPEIFILILSMILALLFRWGLKNLPREEWQVMGCLPQFKREDGIWIGKNFTYYGFFNATAVVLAATTYLVLLGSLSVPIIASVTILIVILVVCLPASRLIALWVERKPHTSTIGGASFIGIIVAPGVILLVNVSLGEWVGFHIPLLPVYAAMFVSYVIGEGVGRLACISFGCCYGKPLTQCHPLIQVIFYKHHFIFAGETKKISYAHHLDGQKVIPVQAITAILYTAVGLLSFYFFLKGFLLISMIITLIITHGWRYISEYFRADYRGSGNTSAYQVMALSAIAYAFSFIIIIPLQRITSPNLVLGLWSLWDPIIVFLLEILWILTFIITGRSRVTSSTIHLFVVKENI